VNPAYYDLLAEYAKLSDIPTLINTSFNMHENRSSAARRRRPAFCAPTSTGSSSGITALPNPRAALQMRRARGRAVTCKTGAPTTVSRKADPTPEGSAARIGVRTAALAGARC
jgi:hypothetical protein